MKYKSIIISILVLVGVSCKTQKFIPPPQPIKLSDSYNPYGTSIEAFKKYYFIGLKNQVLKRNLERDSISNNFYHTNGTPLNNTTISNFTSKKSGYLYERVLIKNGYPQSVYYAKAGVNDTVKTYTYKKGNISGYYIVKNLKDSILYKTSFKRGNGYWKDYYYKINKLREEGQVKNNYKYGAWKYFNKTGKLDSIRNYQLTDSVDVRFPYCFFNKKEPCYKKRSKRKDAYKCGDR